MSDFRVDKDGNIMVTTKVNDEIAKIIKTGANRPVFEIKTEPGLLKRAIQLEKRTLNLSFNYTPVMPLNYINISFSMDSADESE